MTADQIIAQLNLAPHPEGGFYRQSWVAENEGRPTGTCIYFLLRDGGASHWHHVDAVEIWHYYAGAPLLLRMASNDNGPASAHRLGPDLINGEAPQIIVPQGHWQAAQTTGDWTLVGCTVSPGFQFSGFTLAPAGFDIPG
ncbi:cupin domain-containing protein [Octadecabacter sp. R77987]|uniref:cupin domain-containing protein n=1 Tax=Octadecabacter sp. R77987 TaxID=3093874 RepID=UPI00366A9E58